METIIIDKHKKLVFFEDKLVFLRTDVITEYLKEQIFPLESIKKAVIKPGESYWLFFIISELFFSSGYVNGENDRLKLVFYDNTFKFIDTGKLKPDKIREIRNRINAFLKVYLTDNI